MNNNKLNQILEGIKNKKVLVIGDIMLDQYTVGEVSRISPEAPVPVIKYEKTEYRLGGAANTAANLAAYGCKVFLAGVIGNSNSYGAILTDELAYHNINTKFVVFSDCESIIKNRIVGNGQQIARIDTDTDMKNRYKGHIIKELKDFIMYGGVDAIVISDYNKGTICKTGHAELYNFIKETVLSFAKSIPIYVDTKSEMTYYNGVTCMTPNRKELVENYQSLLKTKSIASMDEMVKPLMANTCSDMLVTLGEDGMAYYSLDGKYYFQHAIPVHVWDVSGAGDTVLASMVVARLAGLSIENSLELAAYAAASVVKEKGTTPITINSIRHILMENNNEVC